MRAPMQVLVIPYRIINGKPEYCVFKRADTRYWQFIAGGGEDDETPMEAAIREAFEEAELNKNLNYYQLTSRFSVPADCFASRNIEHWPQNTFVVPEYCFCVNVGDVEIKISQEHTEYRWLPFVEAGKLLYWRTNEVALIELNNRIKHNAFE